MPDTPADHVSSTDAPLKEGATSFGSFYPKHYVLAVFENDAEAAKAAEAVRAAGFATDDVIVASGTDVVAHEATAKAHEGLLAKFGELWSRLYTDEADNSDTLVDFAKHGSAFVLTYAPDGDDTARAAAALRPLNPGVLRKYDTLTITDLT